MIGWIGWHYNRNMFRWELVGYKDNLVIGRTILGWIAIEAIEEAGNKNRIQRAIADTFGIGLPDKAFKQ